MKRLKGIMLILMLAFLFTACGSEAAKEVVATKKVEETVKEVEVIEDKVVEEVETVKSEVLNTPVETSSPETNYQPAFDGQTRVNGVKTVTSYNVDKIASGLRSPWGIAVLPGGSFAITEKGGTMKILSNEGELSDETKGFPAVASGGQGGLLDVKAAPDFSVSRKLYFTYSEPSPDGTVTAVGVGTLSEDNSLIEDFNVIYRALPYYRSEGHYGSRIAIDKNGNLFVSTGDRMNSSNRMRVQELDNGHGKILHITPKGKAVAGGTSENKLPEIYSYGHRNVQGLDISPETGELWASEMGPRGGDELNLILFGKNYGWPLLSYGIEYNGNKIGEGITSLDNMEEPVYYWDPVLAPSGMTFYSSDEIREWKNNLFIGGLKSQHIARIIIEDGKVIGEERLLENLGERFRDVEQGVDGALYAITDGGNVYRIGK